MFGDVLHDAHAHGIRVVGRFDFSKTAKQDFDAHPNGSSARPTARQSFTTDRGQAMKILSEAL